MPVVFSATFYGYLSCVESRVADPHHFNADPDPTFHFAADPDLAPYQSDANLRLMVYRTSAAPF
jgi:hypothetical protein